MPLRFLANREGLDGGTFDPAAMGDGTGNGICPQREAPDPIGENSLRFQAAQDLKAEEELSFSGERRAAGVDVIGGASATREDEIPRAQGSVDQQLSEAFEMFHEKQFNPFSSTVKGRRFGIRPLVLTLGACWALAGCDPVTAPEVDPPFALNGEIRVDVQQSISGEQGNLSAILLWQSDGRWVISERISYRGTGAEAFIRASRGNPGDLAAEYRSLISQLNNTEGLRLFGEVDPNLNPLCSPPRSRVSVTLADRFRGEVRQWTRCADGSLFTMTPGSAGPDPAAARVITAAQLVRFFTLGELAASVHFGSLPFSTLAIGPDLPSRPPGPRVFSSPDGQPPTEWNGFWTENFGSESPPPVIDWSRDVVLLAAVGLRREAGHSVRIRRILPLATHTQIDWVDEIPGDFCSPARRDRFPYHLVVAPKPPSPLRFADADPIRVPCG
jgi:hypothetical protein